MHATACNVPYPYYPSHPGRTGDSLPQRTYGVPGTPIPSIAEQMGADPISKLAAAIEKLADAMREGVRE